MRPLLTTLCLLLYTTCFCQKPSWLLRANVYEVNVRQYTKEGTFKAFGRHLDRLKAMGMDILWFMPINPISKVDRKGTLGSYYAVSDYTAVNPEFGTLADFQELVRAIHARGMKVILDWVPNHTGADHRWLKEHPDFYKKDSTGKAAIPYDWADTRQLDYGNREMRDSMIASMQYWIKNADIDGFRCDVAWNVPGDFWKICIGRLKKIKPLFMLAEGDKPYLAENGFDALYPWEMFHMMVRIAKGDRPAFALDSVLDEYKKIYPDGTLEMYFTSNHDENSWNGADYKTFPGAAHAPFAVLTQLLPANIPLIYGGQEEPNLRALPFFEKDSIGFHAFSRARFYDTLLALRKRNPALDADAYFKRVTLGDPRAVYAFLREKYKKVLVVLNLSPHPQTIRMRSTPLIGYATNVFTHKLVWLNEDHWILEPWGYRVYEYPDHDTFPADPGFVSLHSSRGLIDVRNGTISVNHRNLGQLKDPNVLNYSKRNRVIEDGGSVFLFLEIAGSPNDDRFNVYKITATRAELVADVVSSDVDDMDGDGYLEFGGSDLNEVPPSRDSMYYLGSDYYEIRNGQVIYDSAYTKKVEIDDNGVYLSNPLDKNGNCCVEILKPGKKNTSIIVDTSLVSERIDGPANIRDTTGGNLLFRLNDNVPVYTADTINKWCRIALLVDLNPDELRSLTIRQGSQLLADGKPIGEALSAIRVQRSKEWDQPSKGILQGYTSAVNIKPQTIPEKVLSRIVALNGAMDVSDLDDFAQAFNLATIMDRPYRGLKLSGNRWVYGDAHPTRLLLIFDGRTLYAIIHARKMDYHGSKEYALNGGCILTVVGDPDQLLVDRLIKDYNSSNP